ncbi:MAG TPA: hypothetical protein PKG54_08625 [Phycisphaerae bacterium]|nr:hypothetical protein [Phycisphaerae bacterium]HOB74578.1 hypothetical protein [Phycisphaerae bacterium]HOJ53533.1 hypothetical protein [Phycisphaerae bacterium]HOL25310.1 hypothetical protein [Phycisphaerae bacterium]HPP20475.1 hypothetical protein [Phycisphaerae bacterium]
MPNFSLRRYDTQARVGLILSLLAAVCLLTLAALVLNADKGFEQFSFKDLTVVYGPTRYKMVLASGLVTILLAVSGFGFGLNSAGQRRNDKPALSWISFFMGGTVLCLALVILFFFMRQGQPVIQ